MEKLVYKYSVALKSSHAFERAIKRYKEKCTLASWNEQEVYVISLIKHFELSYIMLHGFLEFYLFEKHGFHAIGTKNIFRALFDRKEITQDELKSLLAAAEAKSEAAHVYDEDFAWQLSQKVVKLYPAMARALFSVVKQVPELKELSNL